MGDKATLAKAIKELEEMYSGVPDESVDLTFQDLANVNQNPNSTQKKKVLTTNNNNNTDMESPNSENNTTIVHEGNISPLRKIPSLDFSKGLQASNQYYHHQHQHQQHSHHNHHPLERINEEDVVHRFSTGRPRDISHQYDRHDQHRTSPINSVAYSGFRHAVEGCMVNGDDRSMASVYQEKIAGRRRTGIPHSKICTVCSTYTYIFRHRCLVCGRVYCRQCVRIGMGEMTEGRKCIECLGRRFSQRYIQRAGEAGCFFSRYPSVVRQAELKWAEKGPRKSGERGYRRGIVSSRPRSPVSPRTPTGPYASSGPNSFVMSASYAPYTPTHHHYPF